MDEDAEPGGLEPEQPAGLDELQPLVHEGRRVDGDLPPHLPASGGEGRPRGAAVRARARGVRKNGPPEAVRMTLRTRLLATPARHWKTPLCSLSTGMMRAPERAASRTRSSPPTTIDSLLARATRLAGPDGGQRRPEAVDAGDGRDDGVGPAVARHFLRPLRAGDDAEAAAPGERPERRGVRGPPHGHEPRAVSLDLPGEERQVRRRRPGPSPRPGRPGGRRRPGRRCRWTPSSRGWRASGSWLPARYFQKYLTMK